MGKVFDRIRAVTTQVKLRTVIIALALFCVSFFVFEPLKSYLCNLSDYWFDFKEYLILIILAALFTFLVLSVLFFLIGIFIPTSLKVISSYVFILTIGLYVQGNFIPNTIGVLDGSAVEWSKINSGMVLSILLWISIIVVLIRITQKKAWKQVGKVVCIVSPLLILLEIVTVISLMISHPNFANESDEYYMSSDEEMQFSSDENFIILILDCFDSTYFREGLDSDLKNALEGFTYYPDTSSMYGHTLCSLSQIITGVPFINQTTYAEYEKEAFADSYLLNHLERNGWNVGIYADYTFHENDMLDNCVNLKKTVPEINSKRKFYTNIYRIVAYNVAPYHLKQLFWFYPQLNELKGVPPEENYSSYQHSNEAFYHSIEEMRIVDNQPRFRLFHIDGMHTPYMTKADVTESDYEVNYEETLAANYTIIGKFVKTLKEKDIYDNSTIIIMSDHGGFDRLEGLKQNPLYMIKKKDEHHGFEISDAEFTYADMDLIYHEIFEDETLKKVSGTRYFLSYDYDTMDNIEEYEIQGRAWENATITLTGRRYVLEAEDE